MAPCSFGSASHFKTKKSNWKWWRICKNEECWMRKILNTPEILRHHPVPLGRGLVGEENRLNIISEREWMSWSSRLFGVCICKHIIQICNCAVRIDCYKIRNKIGNKIWTNYIEKYKDYIRKSLGIMEAEFEMRKGTWNAFSVSSSWRSRAKDWKGRHTGAWERWA